MKKLNYCIKCFAALCLLSLMGCGSFGEGLLLGLTQTLNSAAFNANSSSSSSASYTSSTTSSVPSTPPLPQADVASFNAWNNVQPMPEFQWNNAQTFTWDPNMVNTFVGTPDFNDASTSYSSGSVDTYNSGGSTGGGSSSNSCIRHSTMDYAHCNGTGTCARCNGKGKYFTTDFGIDRWVDPCTVCRGSGKCPSCHGSGRL